jgi:hypothetical protein
MGEETDLKSVPIANMPKYMNVREKGYGWQLINRNGDRLKSVPISD